MSKQIDLQEIIKNHIIKTVCDFFITSLDKINKSTTKTKKRATVYPRQVLEYCLRKIGKFSLSDAGKITGTDHATVFYSCKIIGRDLQIKNYESSGIKLPNIKPIIDKLSKEVEYIRSIKSKTGEGINSSQSYLGKIDLLKSQLREELGKYLMALAIEEQLIKAVKKLEAESVSNIQKSEKPSTRTTEDPNPASDPYLDIPNWYEIIKAERDEVEY